MCGTSVDKTILYYSRTYCVDCSHLHNGSVKAVTTKTAWQSSYSLALALSYCCWNHFCPSPPPPPRFKHYFLIHEEICKAF